MAAEDAGCATSSASSWNFVDALLREQGELTAVERFSRRHSSASHALRESRYRELIPLSDPKPGQQYGFEVDLDACSGCKACVAACHNLNGLEDGEVWRQVGLLQGGNHAEPFLQHVTTACHHCLEPACLHGCPVEAYEKDARTGIVRHWDDQCIGCQYCMLKCPYDVPRYSKAKGIVRKCDMCQDRLLAGEAPACVQSCPSEAIRIRLVDVEDVIDESQTDVFLPGTPSPGLTFPTTTYRTRRSWPRNARPADYYALRPQHGHLPLVWMLVFTQMSVGAFAVQRWFSGEGGEAASSAPRLVHLIAALTLGFIGLGASVFHLGRPRFAYRALLGLRRSWLSREIFAFGAFAAAATAYVGTAILQDSGTFDGIVNRRVVDVSGHAAALAGLLGVFCSVMIYVDTRRPFWTPARTTADFFLTALLLGLPTSLLIILAADLWGERAGASSDRLLVERLGGFLVATAAVKFLLELSILMALRHRRHTPLRRVAMLLAGPLSMTLLRRCFCLAVGGFVLPWLLLSQQTLAPERGFQPLFLGVVGLLMWALLTVGELHARYLFFAASVAPRMPGGGGA